MAINLTIRTAIYIILGIIVFLLLFPLTTKTFAAVPNAFSETECRASVEWRARTDVGILDFESFLPFECSTRTIYVKYDETGRKKDELLTTVTPTYYVAKGDEKKMKKVLAEHWAKCLWMMADGEKQVFGETLPKKKRCVICYDIIVDNDIVDPKKGNLSVLINMDNFLESEKFSKTNTYYKEYLSKYNIEFGDIRLVDDAGNPVSFTVLYSEAKMSKAYTALKTAVASGVAIAGGCIGGALIGTFVAPGPGTIAGLSVGCKLGFAQSALFVAGATGAVYFVGDTVRFCGFVPLTSVSSQCQGMF
ncbi:hypothetical protein KY312_00180 [Candidatus Woesearchaeota archaeon]|nr:hypothetical protein [Candidatus Woesearchaeota archaeon]